MVVMSFLLALADKLCKFLNEVPNFCHAGIGERRADHADDGGGEGARVMIGSGRAVQQELLRSGSGFSGLGCSLCGIGNFLGGRVKAGVVGMIGSRGMGTAQDRVVGGRDVGGVMLQGRWVSHSSGGGVVFAVHVGAEARMLEGVFSLGAMDKGRR